GDELAIVTPMPGTTRDIVRATIQLNGVAVDLLDTAGLRESDDPVEQLGVQRTRAVVQQAHLVLLIEDCTGPSGDWISPFSTDAPTLLVRNKADLLGEPPEDDGLRIHVSAKTGLGMDRLRASIAGRLGLADLEEGVFLARARHLEAIERASRHISAARVAHRDLVLFAEELRLAQAALGEITGELSSDDLLGHIFSRFCIGK
ncbi:MAG: 50S ribosome-binding GTPase, partial [Burkholderiales bacterium]|nr:50S ribosome-binding GTPase [Burkholderiales bacterium]